MDSEMLYTPFDAIRGADDHLFTASSPPSSPCSLTAVDSSPPDSPSLEALKLAGDLDSEDEDECSSDATPTKTRKSSVDMSPAHPYSASTRAAKRPSLYAKDSERSKFKKSKMDPEIVRETLSDSTCRTLNFLPPKSSSAHCSSGIPGRDAYLHTPALEDAISLNDDGAFSKQPTPFQLRMSANAERTLWDDAIDKATMEKETIIDLT